MYIAKTLLTAISLALAGFGFATASEAAMASKVIKVSLTGEGGNPMGAKLDITEIRTGPVEFDVTNDAIGTDHEFVLVKLKSADAKLPLNTSKYRVTEKGLNVIGEVSDLKPGKMGVLKATLKPGSYVVLCNFAHHFELGMTAKLTVTP